MCFRSFSSCSCSCSCLPSSLPFHPSFSSPSSILPLSCSPSHPLTSHPTQICDGTKAVLILASELLEHLLMMGLHPTEIRKGNGLACRKALKELESKFFSLSFYLVLLLCLPSCTILLFFGNLLMLIYDHKQPYQQQPSPPR